MRSLHSLAATALAFAIAAASASGQGYERQQIVPTVGTASMRFGMSMQRDGDVLVVGAPYDDTQAQDSGAVYVYRHDDATDAWNFEQQLFPSDPEYQLQFGSSVAVSGGILVVGSPLDDNARGTDAGSVYVFRYNSTTHVWAQEQKLIASVGMGYDHLGAAVSVSGNVLIAGAPQSDTSAGVDSGSAYVYRYQNSIVKWVEETRLVDSAAAYVNYMGASVIVAGDRAFIGSPLTDFGSPNNDAGTVLTYNYSGGVWTQGTSISSPNKTGYEEFGDAMALDGDLLAIGAPKSDFPGNIWDSGRVFVFRWDGAAWNQEWIVTSPIQSSYQYFGSTIAIDSDMLVIGSPYDDTLGRQNNGSAWIARHGRKGWVLDQQFGASDAANDDRLGQQVALSDTTILVAADGRNNPLANDWGGLYLYPRAEMNFAISPLSPPPDTDVTFSAFYGDTGDNCLITLEDIAGTPKFIPVLLFGFGSDHALTFTSKSPSVIYGISVGLRSYRIGPFGNIVRSEMTTMDL